jgi:hypothetical protein
MIPALQQGGWSTGRPGLVDGDDIERLDDDHGRCAKAFGQSRPDESDL